MNLEKELRAARDPVVVRLIHYTLSTLSEQFSLSDIRDDDVVDTRRLLFGSMVHSARDDSEVRDVSCVFERVGLTCLAPAVVSSAVR